VPDELYNEYAENNYFPKEEPPSRFSEYSVEQDRGYGISAGRTSHSSERDRFRDEALARLTANERLSSSSQDEGAARSRFFENFLEQDRAHTQDSDKLAANERLSSSSQDEGAARSRFSEYSVEQDRAHTQDSDKRAAKERPAAKALRSMKARSIDLLKFIGGKRWVPVVIGALVGFAAGGPAGALVGAGLGLLANEAARQILSSRETRQKARSTPDTGAAQSAERSRSRSSQPTSTGPENGLPTVSRERDRSLRQVDSTAWTRGAQAPAETAQSNLAKAAALGVPQDLAPPARGPGNATTRPPGAAPVNHQGTSQSSPGQRANR
jgi:hypothetical protein